MLGHLSASGRYPLALASLAVLLAVGCQSTGPAAPASGSGAARAPANQAPAAGGSGAPASAGPSQGAIQELYEKAKVEGEVVLWGPSPNTLEWIPDAFARRFPGVKVTWVADDQSPTKVIAEDRAGRRVVDLLMFSLGGLLPVHERKLLDRMDWAAWGVDPNNVLLDGTAGATHNLVYTVMYNTSLVRADQAPKTWDALLAPEWHGKIAASDFTLPRLLAFLVLAWDENRVLEFTRALRDRSGLMLTRTPTEVVLESGERSVGIGQFVNNVERWKDEGKPFEWVRMTPTGAAQFVIAPLTRAPHPNAARLLAGWLASDEGKATAEELRYNSDVRPGSKSRLAQTLREANVQVIIEDPSNVERRAELYNKLSPIVSGQAQ